MFAAGLKANDKPPVPLFHDLVPYTPFGATRKANVAAQKRSEAAKKANATRKLNTAAKKRSDAARKANATRKRNAAAEKAVEMQTAIIPPIPDFPPIL